MPYTPSPGVVQITAGGEAAITNASYRTWGLGSVSAYTLIPQITGRVLMIVTGDVVIGTAASTFTIQLRQGTASFPGPAHDAADTGNAIGGQVAGTLITGALTSPFALMAVVTGLSVPSINGLGVTSAATPCWFDVAVKVSAGTIQLTNLDCTLIEL
jgi:hypothetical protein